MTGKASHMGSISRASVSRLAKWPSPQRLKAERRTDQTCVLQVRFSYSNGPFDLVDPSNKVKRDVVRKGSKIVGARRRSGGASCTRSCLSRSSSVVDKQHRKRDKKSNDEQWGP